MATTTPNFGWAVPTSTDLVKDGAVAIETLGDSIDASLVDLKGGTTGQVLAKATNTDMDFSWTTPTDQTPLTTKGDLFTFTTVDARLGVGTNGQTLVADSSTATGLAWSTPASSGGMTLLSTTTLSGSSISVTGISSAYVNLMIMIENAGLQTTAGVLTANFQTYTTNNFLTSFKSSSTTALNTSSGNIPLSYGETADTSQSVNSFVIQVLNYATSARKALNFSGTYYKGGYIGIWGGGAFEIGGSVSSFQMSTSAGTFSGGTVKIYGVK